MSTSLTSKRIIKALLLKHRAFPSKKFGQNFLIDRLAVKKMLKAANIRPQDIILEVGPGIGTLTQEIAMRAKQVIAVEKDQKMVEILKETLAGLKNVKIIQEDILKIENCPPDGEAGKLSLFGRSPVGGKIENFKVVANLPFYLTAPVIRKFLETKTHPAEMILMVQKEVGQRICAKPPKMNILAMSIQFYAKPEIVSYVSKKSFWPQPKVDSAIMKISNIKNPRSRTPKENKFPMGQASSLQDRQKIEPVASLPVIPPELRKIDKDLFFKVVKAGFLHPRKQLINNLSKALKLDKEKTKLWLKKNNIQPCQRPETLSLEAWIKLTESFPVSF